MSLAGLQSSYEPASQFATVTAGSVVSTESLTVKGVPITGLLSSGAPESAYSGLVGIQTFHDISGVYAPTGFLTQNDATNVVSFSDVVTADASGDWSYNFPKQFKSPPTLTVVPAGGSVGPLLDYYDASGASGFLRYATSQNKFLITGSGEFAGYYSSFTPAGLNPSSLLSVTITDVNTDYYIPFGSFVTPIDLDYRDVVYATSSIAAVVPKNVINNQQQQDYFVILYLSETPSSTSTVLDLYTNTWPSGLAMTTFASTPYNQYTQQILTGIQPNTRYYVTLALPRSPGATLVPSPQTVQFKIDIPKIQYTSTGLIPPPPVAPSSMTVTGGRVSGSRRR